MDKSSLTTAYRLHGRSFVIRWDHISDVELRVSKLLTYYAYDSDLVRALAGEYL